MSRLRELRLQRNYLQEDVAKELHVGRTTYVKYENGQSDPPTSAWIALAKFYNVTVGYLLGVDENDTPPAIRDGSHKGTAMFQLQERDAHNGLSMMELTDTEQRLIETFRALSSQGQEYILNQITIASQVYTKNASVPNAGTEAG